MGIKKVRFETAKTSTSASVALLEQLKENLDKDASLRKDLENTIKGIVVFVIDGEKWCLDLRPGKGKLSRVDSEEEGGDQADITLTMKGSTFVALVSGKIGSQTAFLTRKLKIKGSMGLAMKLQPILDAVKLKASM
eukprot:CAMPEP_0118801286 /NCGR_PEP_ID=MMETSP1161-20130426/2896_1 /TAXON_ID=249345 /ORGANISM="Picochlorum oklahomensis, Strain CCMP2329" /LENGTH=135 /DNA_ID=CAMNT_0006729195 /DNA_START=44 /DNA_END=451 /DNA_ORIENTATION=-